MKYPPNDHFQMNLDKYYQYQKAKINHSLRFFHRQRLDFIFETICNMQDNKSDRFVILDAGCGRGANIIRFAQRRIQVVGVDISEEALKQASSWVKQEGVQEYVTLIRGDIMALPFKDESFDFIISSDVLSIASSTELGLTIMTKLLKKDGTAIIVFPNSNNIFWCGIFLMEKTANVFRITLPEGNKFERYRYRDFKKYVINSGLIIKKVSSVYVVPMLHISPYNKIESFFRSKYPFKYLGSHIIIEAGK